MLFYTFICFFYSTIQLLIPLFHFLKIASKLGNGGSQQSKEHNIWERKRDDSISSPFQIPENGAFVQFLDYAPITAEEHRYVLTAI